MNIVPGAQAERRGGAGPVRGLLGGKASPAALVEYCLDHKDTETQGNPGIWRSCSPPLWLVLLIFHTDQPRRLRPEAAQSLILWLVFLHPRNGLCEPLSGFFLVAELPVGHGQEEAIGAGLKAQLDRLVERRQRARSNPQPGKGRPQAVFSDVTRLGGGLKVFLGDSDR